MKIKTEDVLDVMSPQMGLFGLLFAFMNRLQAAGDSFYREITCKQWFLLVCMNLYTKEAPTANDLAQTMGCSRQNVKEIITVLTKKEILLLKQDKNDKRRQLIYVTPKYKKLAKKYQDKEEDFLKTLFHGISDSDIKKVFQIISKMEKNLTGKGAGLDKDTVPETSRPRPTKENKK